MRLLVCLCLLALVVSSCALSAHPTAPWPSDNSAPAIPGALGVNIHFTDPKPGELAMLAAAGFRWVRMDFVWQSIETEKGTHDFSAYDHLLSALDEHQLRPLFILDYANTLYDGDHAPFTKEGRQAFANWAAAAVKRYRGRGIVWEIYNEPNTGFWTPAPNVADYVKLALETSMAIHQAAPDEQIIGPGVWGFDLEFVEECLRAGLLNYWSAVSVHPYRKTDPESVVDDYTRLRKLIQKYAPANKRVPIISSEWGYSSASFNIGEEKQASLLARQILINQSQGIALSIWYDWRDDGRNPSEIEHHFGTVFAPQYPQRDPLYDPKPAYKATQTLTRFLMNCGFSERLAGHQLSGDDYVLAFRCNGVTKLAAWTTSWLGRTVIVPLSPGTYQLTSVTGEANGEKTSTESGLTLKLSSSPQYLELKFASR
ncbi:MAG TPA: cellulase family glycosylhydrolase [Pyrinomonadaceae bacterium]